MAKPNPQSNIYKFEPAMPAAGEGGEGPAAQRYRGMLHDNYEFHNAFWAAHNAAFKKVGFAWSYLSPPPHQSAQLL